MILSWPSLSLLRKRFLPFGEIQCGNTRERKANFGGWSRRNRQIKMPQFSGVEAEPRGAGAGAAALTATPSQAVHAPHFGQLMAAQG